jgi:hypothetical protein
MLLYYHALHDDAMDRLYNKTEGHRWCPWRAEPVKEYAMDLASIFDRKGRLTLSRLAERQFARTVYVQAVSRSLVLLYLALASAFTLPSAILASDDEMGKKRRKKLQTSESVSQLG